MSNNINYPLFILADLAFSFLFLVSAVLQVLLSRAQKREKRYGPSPSNNYTSGYGKRRFWQKKNNKNKKHDAELGAVGAGALAAEEKHHHDNRNSTFRQSDDTAVASAGNGYGGPNTKYAEPTVPAVHHNPDPYTRSSAAPTTSTNYEPQTTGMTGNNYSEMSSGQMGTADRPIVQHDPKPYADVHHGGFVHSNPESKIYGRNV